MALTDTQKAKCRHYLGYPDQFRYRNTRLESVLSNLSAEAETQVADILTALASIETSILSVALSQGGLKRVDEVEFYSGTSATSSRQNLGRMYAGRLSVVLGVPIYSDVFGKGGYLGDSFFPGFGQGSGGGSIPLG